MTYLYEWTLKYWWVPLFTLSACSLLEFKLFQLKNEAAAFQAKQIELENKRKALLKETSRLKEEIYSLSDPDFVALILMKSLGVVPEGQTKVSLK